MNVLFVKEKDMDFSKFHREWEIARVFNDSGICSACLSPVEPQDEFCLYCGVGFGRYFDLDLVEAL